MARSLPLQYKDLFPMFRFLPYMGFQLAKRSAPYKGRFQECLFELCMGQSRARRFELCTGQSLGRRLKL